MLMSLLLPMKPLNHLLLPVLAGLALASSASATVLRPAWAPGFEYTVSHSNKLNSSIELLGESIDQEVTLSRIVTLNVSFDEKAGEKRIEVSTASYQASVSVLGNDLSFDSEKDGGEANPLILAVIGNLLAPFTIVVDANETILRIDGTEGGGGLSDVTSSIAAQQARDIMAASLTQGFPLEPANLGAKWDFSAELPATKDGKASIEVDFTYAENQMIKGSETAKVTFTGTLGGSFHSAREKTSVTLKDGRYSGHVLVDVENRTTQLAVSTLKGTVSGGKVDLPLTLETTSKLLSLKKSASK
jgi:hypothetical protein